MGLWGFVFVSCVVGSRSGFGGEGRGEKWPRGIAGWGWGEVFSFSLAVAVTGMGGEGC